MERIFVSIASYRDSECPWTLKDLFAKAKYPERVHAGVLWQVDKEDDPALLEVPSWPQQVRGEKVDVSECKGVCWARHLIQQKFWREEEYFFQIDSHSRFDQDWDVKLIRMLDECPSQKPVLTTHPNTYHPPNDIVRGGTPILFANKFSDEGILMPKGKMLGFTQPPRPPLPGAFLGAGFVFAPASMVREVPYDPFLYFQGEEITMAVRLWTHGYDLFAPNDAIVYHDYANNRGRRRHWNDHSDYQTTLNQFSFARVKHLLGVATSSDPQVIQELDKYGLGSVRTLREYQHYADVDFKRRKIGVRAADGLFPSASEIQPERLQLTRRFTDIYLNNGWKSFDTRSGPGSSFRLTADLREEFRWLLEKLKIAILVDAGCGDMNWQAPETEHLDLFLGFDIVEEMVLNNRAVFAHRKNHFFNTADISRDILPRGDAILCRNTLTHLSNEQVVNALRLFKRSESRFLMATTFPGAANTDIEAGQWRAMDLCAPPFSLPQPQQFIQDGEANINRQLGVWRLSEW
ncbi:MAG: hypothetical protein G8345_14340 [Magnetococcales bacterium]|nr:hypothetical protein [Magnetococcales bacterium]NGZ28055.1 hypothetical protein [Magnetococcales bacterium]